MRWTGLCIGVAILLTTFAAHADSLSLYGTYWDADQAGEGGGGGLKLKRETLSLLAADIRGGYVRFDDVGVDLVPVEGTAMIRLPFFIEPYVGVGGGYYFADGGGYDSGFGYFATAGLEIHFLMIGLFAEVRYVDLQENGLDGASANAGLMLLW